MGASFRDLVVWQRAIQMTVAVYKMTATFPKEEQFGLTSQLRRASISIASNVAEGYGRNSRGEYQQFLGIGRGSCCEVETQIVIAKELGFGNSEAVRRAEGLNMEVGKMLRALLESL